MIPIHKGYILSRPDTNEFVYYYHQRDSFMSIGWTVSVEESIIFDSPFEAAPVGGNISEALEQPIEMWELLEATNSLQARFISLYQPQALTQESLEIGEN